MKYKTNLKNKAGELIKRAWSTLGMPFDLIAIDEKAEGVIDVEALLMATLMLMEQDRMVTDLPAWLRRFSSLVNHQKLKTMFKTMPGQHRSAILEKVNRFPFDAAPTSIP